jgi:hypothetical protein
MFDEVLQLARSHTNLSTQTEEKAQELWRKTGNSGIKYGRAAVCLYLAAEMYTTYRLISFAEPKIS